MRKIMLALLFLTGCASVEYQGSPPAINPPYRAVLVAGDGSLPVWDNAVEAMQEIMAPKLARAQTKRLSAAQSVIDQGKAQLATRPAVVAAISVVAAEPVLAVVSPSVAVVSVTVGVISADVMKSVVAVLSD